MTDSWLFQDEEAARGDSCEQAPGQIVSSNQLHLEWRKSDRVSDLATQLGGNAPKINSDSKINLTYSFKI